MQTFKLGILIKIRRDLSGFQCYQCTMNEKILKIKITVRNRSLKNDHVHEE